MDNWGWISRHMQEAAPEFAADRHSLKMIQELRTPVDDLKQYLLRRGKNVQKLQFFIKNPDERWAIAEYIRTHFPGTAVAASLANNLEVNTEAANKGAAVSALAAHLGLDMAQTVAFGDGGNDLSMIRACGLGVAMRNSCREVLEAADCITASCDENGVALLKLQCENHILKPLHENYGIDISDTAIRKAVEEHNRLCRLIREIGDYRKEENPRITGYEYHIINLISYAAPKYLLIPMLEETLEELKTRQPDPKPKFRARVVLVGSEVDDIDMVKLVEESGAYVCADRFCYGSFPGRDPIELTDGEDALTQICRQYMNRAQCPRYMNMPKMLGRRAYVNQLAKDYKADGIIYEQVKFCDPWAYERMVGTQVRRDE